MKKKTNRLLSILLCCVMLISLLPTAALADSYPGAANVSIGGTSFDANAYYKNGDTTSFSGTAGDYNAWYEAATGTLHLNNFTGSGKINCSSAGDLTIDLTGTNTLTVTLAENGDNQAINSSGLITFTGSGSLTVNMTNSGASGKNTAIYGAKGIAVSGSATLAVSVQGGVYDYGIYGGGGVTISENATVNVTTNVTVDGGTGRAIYCDEGAISISSANPTTVTLTGSENNGTNYGIFNIAGNSGTPNNGNITLSGTGKVTVQYQSGPFAYGIISWPTDTAKNPNGVISLTNANVDITNCDQGIVAISQTRGSAADITINNSTLTIDSTKESPEGIVSAKNGILIQDSAVTISSKGGGLSTKHSSYSNTSTYGIDIKGTSTVTLTSKKSGGYMLYGGNVTAVCDFELSGGGTVTLKDVNEHSADMMVSTYIKLGAATTVNDTPGTKHSTEEAYSYGKNDGPLVFTGNYTVTFDNNGGSGSMDNAYASGSYELPTCTFTPPANKVFKAWSVSDTEYAVGASITVNANTTVKAVWQNAYTVSFNNNGGTGAMDAVSVPAGDYTLPACTFTAPDGKAFSGWSTTSNGAVISGSTYNVTQNTELYAIWIAPAQISTLNATLSGFTAGATVGSVTVTAGNATYTATIKNWYEGDNAFNYSNYSALTESATFTAGTKYVVGVNFKPVSPNTLAYSTNATINNEEGLIGASEDGGKTYYVVLTAPSVPVPSATVSDVTISGTKNNAISNTVVTVTLTNDTFENSLSGDWITNLPAGLTQSVARTGDTTATITVSGTPTATSTAQMEITIPAAQLVTSDSNLTVTANANAKYSIAAPTWTVAITAGAGMSTTGNANQTVGQGSPITSVVYTAADGYYFPTNYSVAAQNGIIVTRDSYTQITVSGTPTAAVNLTLTDATAKTKETTPSAEFTAESENGGKLNGVDSTMKYSVDGGSNWIDITGNNMAITNVTTAKGVQVKKPASDANTKLDSDPKIISVTKATAPTTATGVACTTNSNNDGKLQNVTNLMEYKGNTA